MAKSEYVAKAADWFARRSDGQLSESSEAEFRSWWNRSERNREAYRRVEHTWKRMQLMRARGYLKSYSAAADWPADSAGVRGKLPPDFVESACNFSQPARTEWVRKPALAAAFAAIAVGLYFAGHLIPHDFTSIGTEPWVRYETGPYDSVRSIVLPDKSTLRLNSDTRIEVRVGSALREVILKRGDVEFTVAPEAARPFEVRADTTTVRVLGTVFSMLKKDFDNVETLVNSGKVLVVATTSAPQKLGAGQVARVTGGHLHMERPLDSVGDQRLAWTSDKLFFGAGVPLWRAVQEFNSHNYIQLRIDDPRIAYINVGGLFDKHDPEGFAFGLDPSRIRYSVVTSNATHEKLVRLSLAVR
jgi:transmembrane sensor